MVRTRHRLADMPLLLLILIAAALAACSRDSADARGGWGHDAVPVSVAKAEHGTVADDLHAIGTVEPFASVSIKTQVSGQLSGINFREGQHVSKGDLLFVIDPRPFQDELARAQADLARDRARFLQADAEERRWAVLLKQGVGSQERYDQARADADAARAAIASDEAAIRTAQLDLEYASIRSPIDGRTGSALVKPGNLVKAHDDSALVVINQLQPIYVDFAVPEKELDEIQRRSAETPLRVAAAIPGHEREPVDGYLSFVDNAVDRATGTIQLKAQFDNHDERLWPGEFVNVTLTLSQRPNQVLVPSQALQSGQQGPFVFVVGPRMQVEPRPVITGDSIDGRTVIERGVKAGETVVTDGQLRLMPGASVRIKPALDARAGQTP